MEESTRPACAETSGQVWRRMAPARSGRPARVSWAAVGIVLWCGLVDAMWRWSSESVLERDFQ